MSETLREQDEAVWRLIDALVTPMIVGTQAEVMAAHDALRRVRAALIAAPPGSVSYDKADHAAREGVPEGDLP